MTRFKLRQFDKQIPVPTTPLLRARISKYLKEGLKKTMNRSEYIRNLIEKDLKKSGY